MMFILTSLSRWNFIQCLNDDYELIPQNVPDCAMENGMDPQVLLSCARGPVGSGLFNASIIHARKELIFNSCTVRVNGKNFCYYNNLQPQPGCLAADRAKIIRKLCDTYQGDDKPADCNR